MPATNLIYAVDYPLSGWSSWFGPHYPRHMPDGLPFGFVLTSPGSTGRYFALNNGVLGSLAPINDLERAIYRFDFKATLSSVPMFAELTPDEYGSWNFRINFFWPSPVWPNYYYSNQDIFWEFKRSGLTLDRPAVDMIGYPGKVGTHIDLAPINRRRFDQLFGIS